MLEIPESKNMSLQVSEVLTGKTIARVVPPSSPHKFAFYNGDVANYGKLLTGRTIRSGRGHGMFVDILFDDAVYLTIGEGINLRYYPSSGQAPQKHQLQLLFDDDSCVAFTVAMYGGIWAYQGVFDNKYYKGSLDSISPLNDAFNEDYFENIFKQTSKDLSMKALLATEQRIPGLGNGVVQDILFNTGLHPKRKKSTLTDFQQSELFHSLKVTLRNMTDKGGRDTEKDLFGNSGGYKTILSKNTVQEPCPNCSGKIVKEAYLGGAVYYCPVCQKL
jgi:formamidopyrimidine-DNA glycosylase